MSKETKYLSASFYSEDGETLIKNMVCKRIDISNSQSLFYTNMSVTKPHRILTDIDSINIESGIITVHYSNGNFVSITKF